MVDKVSNSVIVYCPNPDCRSPYSAISGSKYLAVCATCRGVIAIDTRGKEKMQQAPSTELTIIKDLTKTPANNGDGAYDPQSSKYMLVFDEALLCVDMTVMSTCERNPNDRNPHRHFAMIQFAIDKDGNLTDAAVNPGMHTKEVLEVQTELGKHGVQTWLPDVLKTRLLEGKSPKHISISRQMITEHAFTHYVDLNDDKTFISELARFPATEEGYKDAVATAHRLASQMNLPVKDKVKAELFEDVN